MSKIVERIGIVCPLDDLQESDECGSINRKCFQETKILEDFNQEKDEFVILELPDIKCGFLELFHDFSAHEEMRNVLFMHLFDRSLNAGDCRLFGFFLFISIVK